MNLPDVRGFVNVGKSFVKANRPEILLGASIAATAVSVVGAAIGGYRSGKQVAEINMKREQEDGAPPLTKAEIVSHTWQNYVPAAGATVGALASTVGLHIVHVQEKKALIATALAAVEEVRVAATGMIEDMNEAIEENTTPKTREKIDAAYMEKSESRWDDGRVRLFSSDGVIEERYLVRDGKTGRDVYANRLIIDQALVEVNDELVHDGEVSLNTFYSHAGFNEIPDGEDLGWNGGDKVDVRWSTTVKDDGRPVSVFTFDPPPHRGYDKSR
jgi:hypothetical protein